MRCSAEDADLGGLTSGVAKSPPSRPALVTVNVAPRSSSGASVPARAPSARRRSSASVASRSSVSRGAQHRRRQAALGLHRDAEVEALPEHDLAPVERGVQLGHGAEAVHGGGEQVGEVRARAARGLEVGEVALLDDRHGRHLAMRAAEVLGDRAAHRVERHAPAAPARRLRRRRADVVGGDAPAGARARDRLEVDAELGGQPAHGRRGLRARLCGRGRGRRRGLWRLRRRRSRRGRCRPGTTAPASHEDAPRRCRPPARGSRPWSCRSGSRRSGSSSAISSPTATSQRAISPSATPSPRSGRRNV